MIGSTFIAAFECSSALGADAYVDVIDLQKQHQTIEYFAASDCWTVQKIGEWSDENRSRVADLLFSSQKGIGLSGWRMNLGGGVEHSGVMHSGVAHSGIRDPLKNADTFEVSQGIYDWSRCPGQRWFLSAARERQVGTFVAFCNSPPQRLTSNGLTLMDPGDDGLTTNLKPGMESQYATYLGDILSHFAKNPDVTQQVTFKYISPLNEPEWDWVSKQEGTRNSNADILKQYKALATELTRRKLSTHILGPESGSLPDLVRLNKDSEAKHRAEFGNYIQLLASDSLLATAMDHEIAFHSYWSDSMPALVDSRIEAARAMSKHPDWRLAQSEYCVMEPGRDLSMDTALRVMRIIHLDLTVTNAVAWSWWLAISNANYKDGLIFTDWHKNGDPENILPSRLFWSLGNFSRFVRPGMKRVELKSTASQQSLQTVLASAYVDSQNGHIAAIYINMGNNPATLQLGIAGKPAQRWIPCITSDRAGDELRTLPAIAPDAQITLPPRSVVTLTNTNEQRGKV